LISGCPRRSGDGYDVSVTSGRGLGFGELHRRRSVADDGPGADAARYGESVAPGSVRTPSSITIGPMPVPAPIRQFDPISMSP